MHPSIKVTLYTSNVFFQTSLFVIFSVQHSKLGLQTIKLFIGAKHMFKGQESKVTMLNVMFLFSETIIYIELNQPNRPTVKRSVSLWRRPCDSAQDSGHVILPISPKIDDLEMTSLTLTMSWDCKIGGIGQTKQVRFGCGATEESEIEHWNFTLQHPFVTSSRLHTFM